VATQDWSRPASAWRLCTLKSGILLLVASEGGLRIPAKVQKILAAGSAQATAWRVHHQATVIFASGRWHLSWHAVPVAKHWRSEDATISIVTASNDWHLRGHTVPVAKRWGSRYATVNVTAASGFPGCAAACNLRGGAESAGDPGLAQHGRGRGPCIWFVPQRRANKSSHWLA